MANEFYTFEEACRHLDKTEAEVRSLVAEGRLHELRDGGKVFFRQDEINQIVAKEGSSIVDLDAAEAVDAGGEDVASFADALSSLKDESSSMGILDQSPQPAPEELALDDAESAAEEVESDSSVGSSNFRLVDDEADASPVVELTADSFPEHLPAAKKPEEADELTSEIDLFPTGEDSSAGMSPLGGISPDIELSPSMEGEAGDIEVPDLGLSGSSIISLEPTGEEEAPPVKKKPPAAPAGTGKTGISVFDDDELQIDADPMGETRISGGIDELETVGSGSGLLDITQESDDTSLGAALLDVISPTEAADTETEDAIDGEPEIISAEAEETVEDSETMVAVDDAEPQFAGAAMAGSAVAVAAPRAAARVGEMVGAVPINITLILGLICMALVGLAAASQIQGVWPSFLNPIASDVIHYSVFGGLGAAVLGVGFWGIFAGRK